MRFCRLAAYYDLIERVTAQQRLERARHAGVAALPMHARVLSAGEGHGRFASICARERPDVKLTCVEQSPAMLARARARLGDSARAIRWECADILEWQTTERFDAIVTCFFLDCFPPVELQRVIAKLAAVANPDATWINVDFAIPVRGVRRWRAQGVHFLMYRFFRLTTGLRATRLVQPGPELRAQGFELVAGREFEWGLFVMNNWRRVATGLRE